MKERKNGIPSGRSDRIKFLEVCDTFGTYAERVMGSKIERINHTKL